MEPAKFFVTGCACVFGACMAINCARAQQFVYPVPPPPPPIFNPSSPNTVPQTRGTPVSPNERQAPLGGNLRPIGQDLRLTIVSTDENDSASKPGVDTDKDGGDADKAGRENPVIRLARCMPRCAPVGCRHRKTRRVTAWNIPCASPSSAMARRAVANSNRDI
jgi:hypothetical protein